MPSPLPALLEVDPHMSKSKPTSRTRLFLSLRRCYVDYHSDARIDFGKSIFYNLFATGTSPIL